MKSRDRIVIVTPMSEIWDDEGLIEAKRECSLSLHNLKGMLSQHPVEFVVASPGNHLKWIPVEKCYAFWKAEVKVHLVRNPDDRFLLEDFPDEYAYVASKWSGELKTPVVLLEKHH